MGVWLPKKWKTIPLTGCDDGGEECDTLRQSQSGNPQVKRSGDVPFQASESLSLSLKYCHTTAHTTIVMYQNPAATMYCNVVCVDHNNVGVLFYPIH